MDYLKHLAREHGLSLNSQQQQAVEQVEGPLLLLSVPGGGKTTVIIARCGNLLMQHQAAAAHILTITFSKAAAVDMQSRFNAVFGCELGERMHFSTIHSYAYRILRTYARQKKFSLPSVLPEGRQGALLRQIYHARTGEYLTEDKQDELAAGLSYCKNMLLTPEEAGVSAVAIKDFPELYDAYQKAKAALQMMDFDDMLYEAYALLQRDTEFSQFLTRGLHYVNIDEAQDNSLLQHRLVRLLGADARSLFMVGDEDQSIYGFRGAYPEALLRFKSDYPNGQVLLMEENYRSTQAIVQCASKIIQQNKNRYPKKMRTSHPPGEAVEVQVLENREDQYDYLLQALLRESESGLCSAVLYRNNISAIPLMDFLERHKYPFSLRDQRPAFFRHWIIADVCAFHRLSCQPDDVTAFTRIYYKLNAFLSKKVCQYVEEQIRPGQNVFDVVLRYPDLNRLSRKIVQEVRHNVARLRKLSRVAMVDAVGGSLGYRQYLVQNSNGNGDSLDNLMQVFTTLRNLACNCNSFEELRQRLRCLYDLAARGHRTDCPLLLSTVHASKGLEFDRVFLIDLYQGIFPSQGSKLTEAEAAARAEEETRLFYVGITRARRHLTLLSSKRVDKQAVKASEFIEQIQPLDRPSLLKKMAHHK